MPKIKGIKTMNRFTTAAYRAVIDHSSDARTYQIGENLEGIMKSAAVAGYPYEICGLLVGKVDEHGWQISDARIVENVNTTRANDRFQLDPVAYQKIDRELRSSEHEIIGVFHSHPDCLAQPSPTDVEHAWDMFLYPIISVVDHAVAKINYWALNDKGTQFLSVGSA
jgi:proteasome lid subunit RPN8/RPN11